MQVIKLVWGYVMEQARTTRTLLAVIVTVVVFAALKATQPITLPLAFGMVLLLFFRPLQRRLERHMPHWVSVIVVMLIVLALLGLAAAAVAYAVSVVAPQVPRYADQLQSQLQGLRSRLQGLGVPLSTGGGGGDSAVSQVATQALSGLGSFASSLSVAVLTLTVLIFLLAEVGGFRRKLGGEAVGPPNSQKLLDAFDKMTGKFERYFLVQAFSSVVTGVFTGLYCGLLGLEFAFVWGLVAGVLNFVPTIGSIVAVVPPTLFALAFGGLGMAALTLLGLGAVQLIMGNFVDPLLQGRALQLSETVVLLSVVFWGWLWGIGGAFIGVPLTIAVVLMLGEFEATRPIARFLSKA